MNLLKVGSIARRLLTSPVVIIPDVITPNQEESLVSELEHVLKRRRYSRDHWDAVIVGYKEVERPFWSDPENSSTVGVIREQIVEAVRDLAFDDVPTDVKEWLPVHVVDLASDGFITPHVDSIKFSGGLVCGVSLLSSAVMTLRPENQQYADNDDASVRMFLPRRSLYVLSGAARYDFTHSIEARASESIELPRPEDGDGEEKGRRISLIFRDAKLAVE